MHRKHDDVFIRRAARIVTWYYQQILLQHENLFPAIENSYSIRKYITTIFWNVTCIVELILQEYHINGKNIDCIGNMFMINRMRVCVWLIHPFTQIKPRMWKQISLPTRILMYRKLKGPQLLAYMKKEHLLQASDAVLQR